MLSSSQSAVYRKLTIGDDAYLATVLAGDDRACDALDDRTSSLVRLAAVIALDGESPALWREVRDAMAAGASVEQITATLLAIARTIGSTMVMSAAPKLSLALGYDVDAGLEDHDTRDPGG